MSKSPSIVVVGGGVSGLATAYLLREIGRERGREANITLLEANNEPGGSTRTEHHDGFLCEWGPNGFLDNEPATLDLVERLNLTDRLVKADAQSSKRFIYHHGKMREVPLKPPAFIVSDILPLPAKLRMAMEFFIPAKRNGEEETVYEFGRRRLGETFAKYMLDPMVSGIFAGDVRYISLPAVFPKMVEMENDYGGLFKALIAKRKEAKRNGTTTAGPGGPSAILHTFHDGMGELTTTLARKLSASVRTASPVKAVAYKDEKFTVQVNGTVLNADVVILASPSFATADMIAEMAGDTANAIR
ncbi:protoporphyrinogen oxidase, partial [bacterium]|nr:protoporphyrinogen oxidase [bacterium]